MSKTLASNETIKKFGGYYKYTLKGVYEGERAEIGTDSLTVLMEGRRKLWRELIGGEPPKLNSVI